MAYGGPWLLDQLWQRLGISAILTGMPGKTRWVAAAERVLFALVATDLTDLLCGWLSILTGELTRDDYPLMASGSAAARGISSLRGE